MYNTRQTGIDWEPREECKPSRWSLEISILITRPGVHTVTACTPGLDSLRSPEMVFDRPLSIHRSFQVEGMSLDGVTCTLGRKRSSREMALEWPIDMQWIMLVFMYPCFSMPYIAIIQCIFEVHSSTWNHVRYVGNRNSFILWNCQIYTKDFYQFSPLWFLHS